MLMPTAVAAAAIITSCCWLTMRARHQPAVEVKGATLTALEVRRASGGGWIAQCVVDV